MFDSHPIFLTMVASHDLVCLSAAFASTNCHFYIQLTICYLPTAVETIFSQPIPAVKISPICRKKG